MRKKFGALLIVGSLSALCAGLLCACKDETEIDKKFNDGYVITVNYDGNGGNVLGSGNVSIVDMFNPDKYTADGDGYVHIKLREPTDPNRPRPGVDPIKVTRGGYTLAGWYQTRTPAKNEAGNVVDDDGNELSYHEDDGFYYRSTTDDEGKPVEEIATPAYTYADPWDFSKPLKVKKSEEKYEMTLYAAWVKQFTFEYYYKPTEESEWTQFGTTAFDCGDETMNTVYIPQWSKDSTDAAGNTVKSTGKMEHKYSENYTFPSVNGYTFKAAYSDEACQNEITRESPFRHEGRIEPSTAAAIDPVKKIYVTFDKGNYYRISRADQFASIADPAGYYTILNDLDFGCEEKDNVLTIPVATNWPLIFMTSDFTGKIEGENGKPVKFSNVGARYNNSNAMLGGLFGRVKSNAVIRGVTFENVVFEYTTATGSRGASLGMFAGEIEDSATVDVSVGGTLRLGNIRISGGEGVNLNLTANGDRKGVKQTEIVLKIFGQARYDSNNDPVNGIYDFDIDPTPEVTGVQADGKITFENTDYFGEKGFKGQYHTVEYQTNHGGEENE